ncbi:MAG: VOC family protein [Anaerolineales bacterium]|jgi:catechol 2,3-dioxygenase-like lactoylglutathione lyase family enzyme
MFAEHIGIYAGDPVELAKWYIEIFGLDIVRTLEKEGRPPIYFLQADQGMVIEILPSKTQRPARELTDPGYSHIGFIVDDFDQASATLKEKGVSLFNVRQTSNGWTIGYFNDPEGNRLEIVYRPQ